MEFHVNPTHQPPKNLYPCLATITITPNTNPTSDRSRRLSQGSTGGDDGNPLQRVISGHRRKTSFGDANFSHSAGGERRKSIVNSGEEGSGKWYWRVQVGVSDTHLLLLPLSQPPNSLLTSPPPPLSAAMPSHSTHPSGGNRTTNPTQTQDESIGITDKIKNLFHRGSVSSQSTAGPASTHTHDSVSSSATAVEGNGQAHGIERVLDQTASGEQLPSARANAAGATNVNANAELGWPGVLGGEKLGEVVVDLRGVEKSKVDLGGGKKNEGSTVYVPITAHFSNMIHGMLEPVGNNHHSLPKSGSIKFEFDKDWIGAKGEAELLHHYIVQAITDLPSKSHDNAQVGQRHIPQTTEFRIGGGGTGGGAQHSSRAGTGGGDLVNPPLGPPVGRDLGPDERY